MKTIIFALLAAFAVSCWALTDSQKEKLETHIKPCREETGASEDAVRKSLDGEFTDDPKLKKNILCVWKRLGLADADGDIVEDKLHERVKDTTDDEEEADKICKKCKVKKDKPEETVFEVTKCLHHELPKFSPVA